MSDDGPGVSEEELAQLLPCAASAATRDRPECRGAVWDSPSCGKWPSGAQWQMAIRHASGHGIVVEIIGRRLTEG